MPNLEKSQAKLEEYRAALVQLKKGEPIVVDGVKLNPSMKDSDAESDLASVERMIRRLESQVDRAKAQQMQKGIAVADENGTPAVGFAPGAHKMFVDANLTDGDIANIIPTGNQGLISRRDVRVYSRAKSAGVLADYVTYNARRRTGKTVEPAKPAQAPKAPAKVVEKEPKSVDAPAEKPKASRGRKPKATKLEAIKSESTKTTVNPIA